MVGDMRVPTLAVVALLAGAAQVLAEGPVLPTVPQHPVPAPVIANKGDPPPPLPDLRRPPLVLPWSMSAQPEESPVPRPPSLVEPAPVSDGDGTSAAG